MIRVVYFIAARAGAHEAHSGHERRETEYLPVQWYWVRAIPMAQRPNDVCVIDAVESVGGEVNESEDQKAVAIFERDHQPTNEIILNRGPQKSTNRPERRLAIVYAMKKYMLMRA